MVKIGVPIAPYYGPIRENSSIEASPTGKLFCVIICQSAEVRIYALY